MAVEDLENKGQVNYSKSLAVKRRGGKKHPWEDSTMQMKGFSQTTVKESLGEVSWGVRSRYP